MTGIQRTVLGSVIAVGALACSAQSNTVPFKQLERDARIVELSAAASAPPNGAAPSRLDGMPSASSSSTGFVRTPPTVKSPRTVSKGFLFLNGLHLGMAIFDVEMTQHCIANGHCSEGNPLMPSSHAGQLSVNLALVGYGTFLSYKFKKHESGLWILSPLAGTAAHTIGVASGFRNR